MRIRGTTALVAIVVLAAGPLRAETPEEAAFKTDVAPLIAEFCAKCHSGEKPKGGIDLTKFADAASIQKSRKNWDAVLEALQVGTMPPEGKPRPSQERMDRAAEWIEAQLSKVDCRIQDDPGRVTLRRLNRTEYRNTVRDLIGVDYEPTEDFPSDDVGYGFDNIGDVLTLPPILMEKYLAAAEAIAARAVVDDNPPRPRVKNLFLPRDIKVGEAFRRNGRRLLGNGAIGLSHEFPEDGEYTLRLQAFGEQAGDEPVKMAFLVDGKEVRQVEVKAADQFDGYQANFHADKGKHRLEVAFLNDYYNEKEPDAKKRDRNLIVRRDFWEVVGPRRDDSKRLPESHKRIVFKRPRGYGDVDTLSQILERLASRAYRRPATAEDVTRLMRIVELGKQDGERIEVGLRLAVTAILVSPNFLFRVELDRDSSGASHLVNDYELASRLSYFLWSTMPDDALLDAAKKGELRSPGGLDQQVMRMLKDEKSRALTRNFATQWLQIRKLRDATPDKAQFPTFDDALRDSMRRETEMFFDAVVREDRSILDFLDSDFTYVDDRLARHYGLPTVGNDEFRRVTLADRRRGGLLTQASLLTVTSNPTRTSPVKRGKWVLEQLLGTPPPPPPPDVPELKEAKDGPLTGSLRQRMEQHRANPNCATCHAKMDPLGFGLENFDAVGAWREKDGEFPIDPSGTLPGGQSFQGPEGLRKILKSKSKEFTRCLTEKLLTFALGRGLEEADRCVVDKISDSVAGDGHRFSRLVLEIVRSDPFQKRKAKGDQGS